jgi:hypothetical protein
MISSDEADLHSLDKLPHFGTLQVVDVVVVGSTKSGAHASVVAGDDNTAATGLLLRVDTVLDAQANLLDGVVQGSGIFVVTNTSKVHHRVGLEDVLGASSGVLSGSTGDELCIVVIQEILVEASVLLFGEDSIVGFEAILLQESFVANCLNI